MLVLRSSSRLTTHNYWTQRTLQLDNNCPQQKQPHTTSFKFSSSLQNSYSKIPEGLKTKTPRQESKIPTAAAQRPHHQQPDNTNYLPQHLNAQFLITVIQKLPFLMNEIRTKKNFSSILNNCSPFTNKKHQQLRQQASKSNKVFLRYTPRDPRLRLIINKHSALSEYLFNYGELIGGSRSSCSCIISFSVPSFRSKFSKQLRHGDKIFVKNSSFIHGECKKKNCTKLLKNIY